MKTKLLHLFLYSVGAKITDTLLEGFFHSLFLPSSILSYKCCHNFEVNMFRPEFLTKVGISSLCLKKGRVKKKQPQMYC